MIKKDILLRKKQKKMPELYVKADEDQILDLFLKRRFWITFCNCL